MCSDGTVDILNVVCLRCPLKTHPSPPRMPEKAIGTFSSDENGVQPVAVTKFRQVDSKSNDFPALNFEDSMVWRLALSTSKNSKTCWTFGVPLVTGIIEFEKFVDHEDSSELRTKRFTKKDPAAISLPTMRVKVAFPRWLSYKTLDIIAHKAHVGWKQYLRLRNVFPSRYEVSKRLYQKSPFQRACDAIKRSGSLNQLRAQFENRDLTPWDEDSIGDTLLMVCIIYSI